MRKTAVRLPPEAPAAAGAPPVMTSGRVLFINSAFNLLGQVLPLVVAIVTIPLLVGRMGTERFGVLTLVWMVIGYFGIFDLGLSRALTKVVAENLARNDSEIGALSWTGLVLMGLMGTVGTLVLLLMAPVLVERVLQVPPALRPETLTSFRLLALSLPIVITTSGLRGILEAAQRFGVLSLIRIGMGVFSFAGPLLVLPFSVRLVPIVVVLVAGRLIAAGVHLVYCVRYLPEMRRRVALRWSLAAPLVRIGSWMTVSNIVSPLMVYMDRFVIGAAITMSAVAYYVTPYEAITKLWLIPSALLGVLFPAFSSAYSVDRARAGLLFRRGVQVVFVAIFPITLVVVAFARTGLTLWLGAAFAEHSTRVLQWLAVGVLVNCLAQVPFTLIQGAGRADLSAKLHLAELPFYLLALWWVVSRFGIVGAAVVWAARAVVDTVLLFIVAERMLPRWGAYMLPRWGAAISMALLVIAGSTVPQGLGWRAVLVGVTVAGFLVICWARILTPEEKAKLRGLARPTWGGGR